MITDDQLNVVWDDNVNLLAGSASVPAPNTLTPTSAATLSLTPGATETFFAFFVQPEIDSKGNALQTYPDWASNTLASSFTFGEGDHLEVVTQFAAPPPAATPPLFNVRLFGGTTFDSDVTYDGVVDAADKRQLDDILTAQYPTVPGSSTWDPTSDINARSPSGATYFPEIGLGDYAPLSVEVGRARNPFLLLGGITTSATGVKTYNAVDYGTAFHPDQGTVQFQPNGLPVSIVPNAQFANNSLLTLASITIQVANPPDGAFETLAATSAFPDITVEPYNPATSTLTLVSNKAGAPAEFQEFAQVLQTLTYQDTSASPTPGPRSIVFQATGSQVDFNLSTYVNQTEGNVATATVFIASDGVVGSGATTTSIPATVSGAGVVTSGANATSFSSTVTAKLAVGNLLQFAGNVTAAIAGEEVKIAGINNGVITVSPALAAAPSGGDTFRRIIPAGSWVQFAGNVTPAIANQIVEITGANSAATVYTVSPALAQAPGSGDAFDILATGTVANGGTTTATSTSFPATVTASLAVGDWVQFAGNVTSALAGEQVQITTINTTGTVPVYTVSPALSAVPNSGDTFQRVILATGTVGNEATTVSVPANVTGSLAVGDWVQFAGNATPAIAKQQVEITGIADGVYTVAPALAAAPGNGDVFYRISAPADVAGSAATTAAILADAVVGTSPLAVASNNDPSLPANNSSGDLSDPLDIFFAQLGQENAG